MRIMGHMETITHIVDRAGALGIPLKVLCQGAGVSLSTVNRWRAGSNGATVNKLNALLQELDRIEASKPTAETASAHRD